MTTPAEYRKLAREAREQAEISSNEERQAAWLKIAEQYEELAKLAERKR
jgi:hypothetical protein